MTTFNKYGWSAILMLFVVGLIGCFLMGIISEKPVKQYYLNGYDSIKINADIEWALQPTVSGTVQDIANILFS